MTGVGGTNLITAHSRTNLTSAYVRENETGDRFDVADIYGTGNLITNGLWGSGSGISTIFAKPAFQSTIPVPGSGRSVPDVSMHMGGCPGFPPPTVVSCDVNRDSYDLAYIGGSIFGLIGTSASSPEFAGLLAVKESVIHSRLGNENPELYTLAASNATGRYFRQGIYAYNGVVHVAPGQLGYSPVIGVGTPITNNFVGLPSAALAGNPRSRTNP